MKFLKDKKLFLIIVMVSTMFFMFGFVVMKLILPKSKKPEIKINVEQSKNPPPPPPQLPITHEQQFNNTQQKQQETNPGPGTPVTNPVGNPGGVEREKIKEISKHDVEKKEHRDVFKDFYLTKQKDNKNDKNDKDKQQKIEQQNIPPLPPPIPVSSTNSTNIDTSSIQQTQRYKDVKIYGFYVRDNETFVITNIGILSRNSRIDNNEIVLDITRNKIITNMREIFF